MMSDVVISALITAVFSFLGTVLSAYISTPNLGSHASKSRRKGEKDSQQSPGSLPMRLKNTMRTPYPYLSIAVGIAAGLWFYISQPVPIETMKYWAVPYTLSPSAQSTMLLLNDGRNAPHTYEIQTVLPTDEDVYAGFVFSFQEPQDLSMYNDIEITVDFGKDRAAVFDLFIKDKSLSADAPWRRVGYTISDSDSAIQHVGDNLVKARFSLAEFAGINHRMIKEIGFSVGSSTSPGKHSFVVKEVNFHR